jgi:broad specificity phosphatase PhoE
LKIHLVRHAETIWHADDKYSGKAEISLTANGIQQSFQLANWAKAQNIDAIYTSELSRAIITAQPSARLLNLVPIINSNLNEVNYGKIEGLTKTEFKNKFPDVWEKFQVSPADTVFPSGESGSDALNRALKFILDLLQKKDISEVLLVSHGTLIRLILTYLLDKDLNKYRSLFPVINNIGITTFTLENLKTQNEIRRNFQIYTYNYYFYTD